MSSSGIASMWVSPRMIKQPTVVNPKMLLHGLFCLGCFIKLRDTHFHNVLRCMNNDSTDPAVRALPPTSFLGSRATCWARAFHVHRLLPMQNLAGSTLPCALHDISLTSCHYKPSNVPHRPIYLPRYHHIQTTRTSPRYAELARHNSLPELAQSHGLR